MTGPRLGILVGDQWFPTQKAAIQHCQVILYACAEGSQVADGGHLTFLAALLALHPDAKKKVGAGIAAFEVHHNLKTPGFWVVRTDESKEDFSFYKCIRPPTHAQTVRAAMRREVVDQVLAARDAAFAENAELACPITGELITAETCQVDHYNPTFLELANDFAAELGGYEGIKVMPQASGIGSQLADAETATRWRDFHRERAQLRAVSIKANLSILTKQIDEA